MTYTQSMSTYAGEPGAREGVFPQPLPRTSAFQQNTNHASNSLAKKRKFNQLNPNANANAPNPEVAPAVPSFGISLPRKPSSPPTTHNGLPKKKPKKPRKYNQLGLTPRKEEHEDSGEDDVDEEAKFAHLGALLRVEYKGRIANLSSPAALTTWIAERKKRWPTRARVEEKERKTRERQAQEKEAHEREIREREEREREAQELRARELQELRAVSSKKTRAERRKTEKLSRNHRAPEDQGIKTSKPGSKEGLRAVRLLPSKFSNLEGQSSPLNLDVFEQVICVPSSARSASSIGPEGAPSLNDNSKITTTAHMVRLDHLITLASTTFKMTPTSTMDSVIEGSRFFAETRKVSSDLSSSRMPAADSSEMSSEVSKSTDSSELSDSSDSSDSSPDEESSKQQPAVPKPLPSIDPAIPVGVCHHYYTKGSCKFGRGCKYKHLRPPSVKSKSTANNSNRNEGKTAISRIRKTLNQRLRQQEDEENDEIALQAILCLAASNFFDSA
ncbi:MAG: hypothetical protein Q9157_008796 [Trypethelium eluteriae]